MSAPSRKGPRPNVGGELILEDDIEFGDLVRFVRRSDGNTGVRRLVGPELDMYKGEVFRFDEGDKPGSFRIALFRRAI